MTSNVHPQPPRLASIRTVTGSLGLASECGCFLGRIQSTAPACLMSLPFLGSGTKHCFTKAKKAAKSSPVPVFSQAAPRLPKHSTVQHLRAASDLSEQTRLSSLCRNPGPKRGSPGATEQHIAGPWHVVALQESIDFINNDGIKKQFQVAHFRGCALFPTTFSGDPDSLTCLKPYRAPSLRSKKGVTTQAEAMQPKSVHSVPLQVSCIMFGVVTRVGGTFLIFTEGGLRE